MKFIKFLQKLKITQEFKVSFTFRGPLKFKDSVYQAKLTTWEGIHVSIKFRGSETLNYCFCPEKFKTFSQ